MSSTPHELSRAEGRVDEESGFSGPANSLTTESIDCGCAHFHLPKLARFATRRNFLALLCYIGLLQAAAQAYLSVIGSTIARKYLIDPYLMSWILYLAEMAPILVGLPVAYWGDRIHRAAWLGGLNLVQCAGMLACVIPHVSRWSTSSFLSDDVEGFNQTITATHMSIYSEDSPELCLPMLPLKMINKEDVPRYTTLAILIIFQVVSGMASVAYYALGVSYLDDNTKKVNVSVYLSVVVAARALGTLLGYLLGWSFLRLDADDLSSVMSYREKIGAWWLGWPIFAFLLAILSIFMAMFPRKLPSEMVEQAAATILHQSGTMRGSQRFRIKRVGSTYFLPSLGRLVTNKLLIFNLLAAAFTLTALINFSANENVLLESRFYAPRPTGKLFGFGDPVLSRLITTTMKPVLIGFTIIITGLVIGRSKPTARTLIKHSVIVLVLSAFAILSLSFNDCKRVSIRGSDHTGPFKFIESCSLDCGCSRDADFRPICDSRGLYTFYSPCHAGCTSIEIINDNKIYRNCSCANKLNMELAEPCNLNACWIGWLIHEILTMFIYATVASTVIGDLLVILRSVNVQDKALMMGYGLAFLGFFAYVPGKFGYDQLVKSTCEHWGFKENICHLHRSSLASYLCFLTAGIVFISAVLKMAVWCFCGNLEIYDSVDDDAEEEQPGRSQEMIVLSQGQVTEPLLKNDGETGMSEEPSSEQVAGPVRSSSLEPDVVVDNPLGKTNGPVANIVNENQGESSGRLRYGPLGPGNRRTDSQDQSVNKESSDSESENKDTKISTNPYKQLADSDTESDNGQVKPVAKSQSTSSNLDELIKPPHRIQPRRSKCFPNPDDYADPRLDRSSRHDSPLTANEFVPAMSIHTKGDFNHVGIPFVDGYEPTSSEHNALRSPTLMMVMADKPLSAKSSPTERYSWLKKLDQPLEDYSSRGIETVARDRNSSSGFESLQDLPEATTITKRRGQVDGSRGSLSSKTSDSEVSRKGSPRCTNL